MAKKTKKGGIRCIAALVADGHLVPSAISKGLYEWNSGDRDSAVCMK